MLIVADENIPLLESFFADIGTLRRLPGRHLQADDVKDADVLLVRSVTSVNAGLLAGSRVKFVGTATIGTDHVDTAWLQQQGIGFASAPGCNASSVVEYVLCCLSLIAEERGQSWEDLTVGVVGRGNVGGRLVERLQRLGISVLVNDPPLAAQGVTGLVSLDEVMQADVISLHTPLVKDGAWPTLHLFDEARLARLRPDQVLINSGRGAVVDNQALLRLLSARPSQRVALDVWEGEPAVLLELAQRVWLGTPHIAGYSLEGKVLGTEMIYKALCQSLGLPVRKRAGQFLPEPPLGRLCFTAQAEPEWAMHLALRAVYDVRQDALRFRRTLALPDTERVAAFDELRRTYPIRRECCSVKVLLKAPRQDLQQGFSALGFKLVAS